MAARRSRSRTCLLYTSNDYGQATLEGFKSAAPQFGVEILGEYHYPLRDRQFGSIVASVKRDNPKAVYITCLLYTSSETTPRTPADAKANGHCQGGEGSVRRIAGTSQRGR